jgi:hypothetical protein
MRSCKASTFGLAALALASVLVGFVIPEEARADVAIELEPRASFIVPGDPYPGVGLATTAGLSLDLEPILVMPEIELAGDGFPSLHAGTFRAMGGVRVGLTAAVVPAVFLHVGYGFLGQSGVYAHAFSLDTGFSLDYRISRLFTIGGTLGYETLANGDGAVHGAFIGPRLSFWID